MKKRSRNTKGQFKTKPSIAGFIILAVVVSVGLISGIAAVKAQMHQEPCQLIDATSAVICNGKVSDYGIPQEFQVGNLHINK